MFFCSRSLHSVFSLRFFRREPEKDLLSLHRLRHLVQLELLVERSFILRDYLNGHPWPSPCVQELINQLRELSENRITVITTMRQRNPLRECDCVWEGDWRGTGNWRSRLIPPEEDATRVGNRRLNWRSLENDINEACWRYSDFKS